MCELLILVEVVSRKKKDDGDQAMHICITLTIAFLGTVISTVYNDATQLARAVDAGYEDTRMRIMQVISFFFF